MEDEELAWLRALDRLAQARRRRQVAKARQVVVGVDQLPAERERRDTGDRRRRGDVRVAELLQQGGGVRCHVAARRAEPERPAERLHPALQELALAVDIRPMLVAPAVVRDLVAAIGDLRQRVRIQLRVQAFDEERGPVPRLAQQVEHARQRTGDRRVAPERLPGRPLAALQGGGLAEVVEGQAERREMSNRHARWSPSGSTGRTSAGLTAPIVSFSRYGSSGKKTCVTSVLWPGAVTLKWMCAGRHGCCPIAAR